MFFLCIFFFFTNRKIFSSNLTLHNSKSKCDRQKQIVDLESTSKNTPIKRKNKILKNTRNYRNFTNDWNSLCKWRISYPRALAVFYEKLSFVESWCARLELRIRHSLLFAWGVRAKKKKNYQRLVKVNTPVLKNVHQKKEK